MTGVQHMPPASQTAPFIDIYLHVRVLLAMIIGLGLTHLLRHFAMIIERPRKAGIYWVHLIWALSMFLYLLHFWWWEFRLESVHRWSFNLYLFVVIYALLLYLLSALIFPDSVAEYGGYRDYFYSRRQWFFGFLAIMYVVDYADTWVKGVDYLRSFGIEYPIRNISYIVLSIIAMSTRNARYHATFAVGGLVYQLSWIVRAFETL
jgi:hypothetical protein